MSLAVSPRRDQRRRLVALWKRSEPSAATAAPAAAQPRRLADYSPEALPERQPALATLVPTGLGGLALAATAVLAAVALSLGVGVWEAVGGSPPLAGGGRFARTLAALRACLDLGTLESLGGAVAQTCLVTAIAGALVVRSMRRHRRDDFKGRYRAWGWLAGLFAVTACAGAMPLGPLVSAFVSDATGIVLGPSGMGWWVLGATIAFAAVGLWAVLPLHERVATATWLVSALAVWAGGAAAGLLAAAEEGDPGWQVAANAAWVGGAGMAAMAMLAAARSVIREVRGLPNRREVRPAGVTTAQPRAGAQPKAGAQPEAGAQPTAGKAANTAKAPPAAAVASSRETGRDRDADDDARATRIGFVDGSDAEDDEGDPSGRHLSKAERKRLRKLSRLNRAA